MNAKFLYLVVFTLITQGCVASDRYSVNSNWKIFQDNSQPITFRFPPDHLVRVMGNKIYLVPPKYQSVNSERIARNRPRTKVPTNPDIEYALNGWLMADEGRYLAQMTWGVGDFSQANVLHHVFEVGDDGHAVITWGRFRNTPVKPRQWGDWRGLESVILCSTSDEETGFHAAGGKCYLALISNGQHYVLLSSQPLVGAQQEKMLRQIASTVKDVSARIQK